MGGIEWEDGIFIVITRSTPLSLVGPLEAMVETQRFFDSDDEKVKLHDTGFGKLLLSLSSNLNLPFLASNPSLLTGPKGACKPAFDLTEGLDAMAAGVLLSQCSV